MTKVYASAVLDAPVATIWNIIRDFSAVNQWLPGVSRSDLEANSGSTSVGSTRHLTFEDGSTMREQLLALSDAETFVTFTILASEVPVRDYVTTIRLQPITDGDRTFISWSSEFAVDPDQEAAMRRRMANDIYLPGFASLNEMFGRQALGATS